jgi:osmotically-inducible protein OsmY
VRRYEMENRGKALRERKRNAAIGIGGFLFFILLFGIVPHPVTALEITNREITWAVMAALLNDAGMHSHFIDVKTENGIVMLSGPVDNLLAKERAVKIAETVKGVRSVVNRITVKPGPIADHQIHRLVRMALLSDPATGSYDIGVRVQGASVVLTGTVGSWQEKQLCGEVAKGIKGVKDLQNNIRVEYNTKWSDREIEAVIKDRLEWDVWVDDGLIEVDVINGSVTLRGTVGSAAEKAEAEADAWESGVRSVDMSGLKVDWSMRDVMKRGRTCTLKSDGEVEKAIKSAFLHDPRVKSCNPAVEVADGVVTLTGVVENLKAKNAAEQDARNTVGVWRVKNFLRVRATKTENSDFEIKEDIKNEPQRGPFLYSNEVGVTVKDSLTNLTGTVDSWRERCATEDKAYEGGAKRVRNYLKVRHGGPSHHLP